MVVPVVVAVIATHYVVVAWVMEAHAAMEDVRGWEVEAHGSTSWNATSRGGTRRLDFGALLSFDLPMQLAAHSAQATGVTASYGDRQKDWRSQTFGGMALSQSLAQIPRQDPLTSLQQTMCLLWMQGWVAVVPAYIGKP